MRRQIRLAKDEGHLSRRGKKNEITESCWKAAVVFQKIRPRKTRRRGEDGASAAALSLVRG